MAGYYDMDWHYNAYYEKETRTEELFEGFMNKWVYGTKDRNDYLKLLGEERLEAFRPESFESDPVSYGKLTRHIGAPYA